MWSNVEWSQLYRPDSFRWQHGVTPFSHVLFLTIMSVYQVHVCRTPRATQRATREREKAERKRGGEGGEGGGVLDRLDQS
jgi:hypothetical protein